MGATLGTAADGVDVDGTPGTEADDADTLLGNESVGATLGTTADDVGVGSIIGTIADDADTLLGDEGVGATLGATTDGVGVGGIIGTIADDAGALLGDAANAVIDDKGVCCGVATAEDDFEAREGREGGVDDDVDVGVKSDCSVGNA